MNARHWFYSQSFNGRSQQAKLNFDNHNSFSSKPENWIVLDENNVGSFFGPLASPYSYTSELRKRLDEIFQAAQSSTNRYFVLEGKTVKAAQSTLNGAQSYMANNRVLVTVEL